MGGRPNYDLDGACSSRVPARARAGMMLAVESPSVGRVTDSPRRASLPALRRRSERSFSSSYSQLWHSKPSERGAFVGLEEGVKFAEGPLGLEDEKRPRRPRLQGAVVDAAESFVPQSSQPSTSVVDSNDCCVPQTHNEFVVSSHIDNGNRFLVDLEALKRAGGRL